ncbi:hypothetical protein L1987_52820 [Smallanthus sonchifolius]|uniref:Uncharacterized protein n=1 Tax=Smallanthus sonchifolius TaxID=185202 RepID=A0ACB9EUA6_9ASTR|nr:hypothetical protein L1987_52820 [Smallanthus sonchifolius]
MMNSIPHFDDVVDLDEDDEDELETNLREDSPCELPLYRRAEGIFGNPMAKKMRAKLARATGAGEAPYSTRESGNKRGANSKTSSSSSRPRGLVDEPDYDFDVDAEENDVAAYKDFLPTSDPDDDDELEFEDITD